jgi:hypothetical protein
MPHNREMPTTRLRSGTLAAWTSEWLAGRAASDEVIRATVGLDAPHQVAGLHEDLVPLSEALISWRRGGAAGTRGRGTPSEQCTDRRHLARAPGRGAAA